MAKILTGIPAVQLESLKTIKVGTSTGETTLEEHQYSAGSSGTITRTGLLLADTAFVNSKVKEVKDEITRVDNILALTIKSDTTAFGVIKDSFEVVNNNFDELYREVLTKDFRNLPQFDSIVEGTQYIMEKVGGKLTFKPLIIPKNEIIYKKVVIDSLTVTQHFNDIYAAFKRHVNVLYCRRPTQPTNSEPTYEAAIVRMNFADKHVYSSEGDISSQTLGIVGSEVHYIEWFELEGGTMDSVTAAQLVNTSDIVVSGQQGNIGITVTPRTGFDVTWPSPLPTGITVTTATSPLRYIFSVKLPATLDSWVSGVYEKGVWKSIDATKTAVNGATSPAAGSFVKTTVAAAVAGLKVIPTITGTSAPTGVAPDALLNQVFNTTAVNGLPQWIAKIFDQGSSNTIGRFIPGYPTDMSNILLTAFVNNLGVSTANSITVEFYTDSAYTTKVVDTTLANATNYFVKISWPEPSVVNFGGAAVSELKLGSIQLTLFKEIVTVAVMEEFIKKQLTFKGKPFDLKAGALVPPSGEVSVSTTLLKAVAGETDTWEVLPGSTYTAADAKVYGIGGYKVHIEVSGLLQKFDTAKDGTWESADDTTALVDSAPGGLNRA